MTDPILSIRALRKAYGGLLVTSNVDLDVMPNEIHALIGPNGAGKSTLIGQIVGDIKPDSGTIRWMREDLGGVPPHQRVRRGMVRTFQISSILPEMTVSDNVRLAALGPSLGITQSMRPVESFEMAAVKAETALRRVGLEYRAGMIAGKLSYGERRHLEIAMALALSPKLLLMDEPMAGVGPSESSALTELLKTVGRECAIVLVEHDMDVVFSLASKISVLVSGDLVACDVPDKIRNDPEVQRAYFGMEEA